MIKKLRGMGSKVHLVFYHGLSVAMSGKGPYTNLPERDRVFYHLVFVTRDDDYQPLERLMCGYLVFYHGLLLSPGFDVRLVHVVKIAGILPDPFLLRSLLPCFGTLRAAT
jgi:hypothetical protein